MTPGRIGEPFVIRDEPGILDGVAGTPAWSLDIGKDAFRLLLLGDKDVLRVIVGLERSGDSGILRGGVSITTSGDSRAFMLDDGVPSMA